MTEIMPVPRNLILLSYQQRASGQPFFEILRKIDGFQSVGQSPGHDVVSGAVGMDLIAEGIGGAVARAVAADLRGIEIDQRHAVMRGHFCDQFVVFGQLDAAFCDFVLPGHVRDVHHQELGVRIGRLDLNH